ncbi:MAG: glycosyltransferase involved in cell wall biosynthesis, partial [Parasphingorhabdus sp.]
MPDKAPVSVILPTYNRAATISRAIISVLNQYPQPLELIVVDDGSYDDTRNVIESLAAQQIRYLQLPQNVGAHVARNAGILAARGDFIAFQDSDDELMPGFIQEHLNAFKRCKKADVSVVCAVRLSPTGVQRPIPKRSRLNLECCGDFSNHLMGGSFIGAPMMMIKRSVLIDVGMFDERRTHLMEDWELAI